VQQFQHSWHHANAEIYWLDEKIEVHRLRKLANSRLYKKTKNDHNKEMKKWSTSYLNLTAQNQKMEKIEKQVDNGTAVDNLVFALCEMIF